MNSIETLMKDAKDFFDRVNISGETDWIEEAENIPDDFYPEENNGNSSQVMAADTKEPKPKTDFEKISEQVMEGLTDVAPQWLSPVKPFFDRLAALAMSKTVTDEDFIKALEKAQEALPELFDRFNTEALEQAFEIAISSSMLEGSTERLTNDDLANV